STRQRKTPETVRSRALHVARELLGLFQHLDETPPLGGRRRAGLHQRDAVADAGDAVLVVRLDLLGRPDDLAVQRVTHTVFQLDHDGLLHLVAHDVADARLAPATRLRVRRSVLGALRFRSAILRSGLLGGGLSFCHHDSLPSGPDARPSSRSRSTVYTRAISE